MTPGSDWEALTVHTAPDVRARRRREEIARDLLLKLVESTPGALKYDTKFQVAKALEYTDELLAQLDKGEAQCGKTK